MKKLMKALMVISCLFMTVATTGCGDLITFLNTPAGITKGEDASKDISPDDVVVDNKKKFHISIASGSSGGAYYMVGTALAQVMQEHDPLLICSSESTGGTNENLALISSEESTIGMGMADDIVDAYKGNKDFKGFPATNLRVITSGQTNTFQIFVRADSDIKNLEDLKGRKISLGPAGAPYFVPNLLKSTCGFEKGKDYDGQYLAHNQAADALADGDVDAVIACLAYPASAFSNMAYTKDVRMIPITEEQVKKALEKNPTWVKGTIPKGTYKGTDADTPSLSIPVWLFTYASMDPSAIYRCTKTIFENVKELGMINSEAGKYKLENATKGVVIPVHPGAQRYFNEMMKK